jgi:hypothetical protein
VAVAVAKYDAPFEFLCRADDRPVEMSFDEIESLVGPLPPSATAQPAWWSSESGRHVRAGMARRGS